MPYREKLVKTYDDVVESTKSFNAGLNEVPRLSKRTSNVKAWYYIPEIDAVGPSKFIGYRGMSADFYLAHSGKLANATLPKSKRLDGRETEPRLTEWFEITEPGTVEYEYVSKKVQELLDQWDKKPGSSARYCVPIGFKLLVQQSSSVTRTSAAGGRQMTHLLRKATKIATELSESEQDRIARFLLEEMQSERRWDELFASPKSEVFLEGMTDDAIAEHQAGRTRPLNVEDL